LSPALLGNPNAAIEAAHRIAERLNEQSEQERLWHGEVIAGGSWSSAVTVRGSASGI